MKPADASSAPGGDAEPRSPNRAKLFLSVCGCVCAAAAAAGGAYLHIKHVHVPVVESAPFGLFTLAAVLALLSADALIDACACRSRTKRVLAQEQNRARAQVRASRQKQGLYDADGADDVVAWHALTPQECVQRLHLDVGDPTVALRRGLDAKKAADMLTLGRNEIPPDEARPLWRAILQELHEPQELLLLLVAVLYSLVGQADEAGLALGVIVLMVLADVLTEYRAQRALAALQTSVPHTASVLRGGTVQSIPRAEVVPGDVLLLQRGDEVAADARVIEASDVQCDESQLTGECVPVQKTPEVLERDTGLGDRHNMVHAGSAVVSGSGRAVVVATGTHTEVGRTLTETRKAKANPKPTPLQELLRLISARLTVVAVIASIAGGLLGFARHMPWQDIVLISLALAFATIPEEPPILIAAVLAVGARALSKDNIYVKRLRALESMSDVDIVLTDKTGTMTQNKLRVVAAVVPAGGADTWQVIAFEKLSTRGTGRQEALTALLQAWRMMCEDVILPSLGSSDASEWRDPFDTAIAHSIPDESPFPAVPEGMRVVRDIPFDSTRKYAARMLQSGGDAQQVVILKGAPEAIRSACGMRLERSSHLHDILEQCAGRGWRMLAFAQGSALPAAAGDHEGGAPSDHANKPLGILCFEDPLRPEVPDAVTTCRQAGVRVVMVTGDHPLAAAAIARAAGMDVDSSAYGVIHCAQPPRALLEQPQQDDVAVDVPGGDEARDPNQLTSPLLRQDRASSAAADTIKVAWMKRAIAQGAAVFARASPTDKLALVHACEQLEFTSVVTGDGANDAPALAAADVGIAVQNATDIAREACSILVVNGNFSSLTLALRQGRRLFDNLSHALAFYLGVKLGLVLSFLAATAWEGFPLSPVLIIIMELLNNMGASLSFVAEPAEAGVLQRPPRDKHARFFDLLMICRIIAGAISIVIMLLGGYTYGRYSPWASGPTAVCAQTCAFVCWLLGHVMLAVNQRTATEPTLLAKSLLANKVMLCWIAVAVGLAALAGASHTVADALGLAVLSPQDWGIVTGIAFVGTFWVEAIKWLAWCAPRGRKRRISEKASLPAPATPYHWQSAGAARTTAAAEHATPTATGAYEPRPFPTPRAAGAAAPTMLGA